MSSSLDAFKTLFRGSRSCYGIHIPETEDTTEGEKRKGKSFTKQAPIEEEHYAAHIAGDLSLGVVPIDHENNVNFMAIDVDVYPMNPIKYSALFLKHSLPFVCFRSKSGGLHAYCFFTNPTPAESALECLHSVRSVLGLAKTTETFPKQRRLALNSVGNWINLPYFGGERTQRYAYDYQGTPMSFEVAMEYCMSLRCSIKSLKDTIEHLPFSPAPPCLQTLYINGEVTAGAHNRNIFMFNVGCYLKSRFGDEFESRVQLVNTSLPEPMTQVELDKTVILSHKKGSYSYQCDNPTLSLYCDKAICETREYGKGSDTVSDFNFETLTQVQSSPPYYKWIINGVEMIFYGEDELRKQDKFIDYCIRHLHKCPNRLKGAKWTAILNKSLGTLQIEKVSEGEEVSSDMLFASYFREFMESRAFAMNIGQVKMGKVFKDIERNVFVFRVEDLVQFLDGTKRFKYPTLNQLHSRLKLYGASASKTYDQQLKKTFRTWHLPLTAFDKDMENPVATPEQVTKTSQETRDTADKLIEAMQKLQDEDAMLPENTVDFKQFKTEDDF